MRVRVTCKCGAELEARGVVGNVTRKWDEWTALHLRCLGISSIDPTAERGRHVKVKFLSEPSP